MNSNQVFPARAKPYFLSPFYFLITNYWINFALFFLLLKMKWFPLLAWFVRVDQALANGLCETVSLSISVAHEIMNGSTFESGDIWIVGKRSIAPLRSTGTIKVMPNLFYFL